MSSLFGLLLVSSIARLLLVTEGCFSIAFLFLLQAVLVALGCEQEELLYATDVHLQS